LVSNFEAWLEDLLVDLGVRETFGVRVISGIEGIEKPDSRIYELALERANVAADESVFVGDNPEFDVIPPAELGMFTVLVAQRNLRTEITELAELGILLRDPETGLVDFPAEREGRRVFLCWRLGEAEVGFYHEETTGYSGRKPL